MTSDPGSFAQRTLQVRVPRIVEETAAQTPFPPDIRARLAGLRDELLGGVAQPLHEEAPDRAFWNEIGVPYLGRSWLDVPWYWAEAFLYRRVLEATGYFQPGPWRGVDPFRPTKETEWQPDTAPRAAETLLAALPEGRSARFAMLLQGSLWGNRVDLSYRAVMAQLARGGGGNGVEAHHAGDAANLLVDDTARVWGWLEAAPPGARITVVADNAGTELAMDLALIDFLLVENLAGEVHLHLKGQPFFVSDAMPADLDDALAALAAGGPAAAALAGRIATHRAEGRLQVRAHWLYTTCLHYFQMPSDLREDLAAGRLVIFKGDANYRRLVGDAHWPPTTPFAAATAYFPAPLLALRTLKAELITGLGPGEAEALARIDPQWLVNGVRGLIQCSGL
jgi:uncharacterized protein with ATP-grasp and redox domains